MPSWPTGVQTTTVTFGKGITVDGNVTSATLTVTPVFSGTKAVKWATDSTPLLPFVVTATANAGAYGSVQLPVVDQAGWKDDGQHDYSLWAYKLEELPKYGTTVGAVRTKYVQPLTGQTTIDFDDIPDGSVGLPASAPVVPVSSVAGLTGAVTVDELAQAGVGGATDAGLNAILTNPASASAMSLAATQAALEARIADTYQKPPIGGTTANFDSRWFFQSRRGLFVHYAWGGSGQAETVYRNGTVATTLDQFAADFDAVQFAADVAAMGVDYVIFTAWHYAMHALYPSSVLNAAIPGHASSRDVIADLITALAPTGVKLVLYVHATDGGDLTSGEQTATGWTDATNNYATWQTFINNLLTEVGLRYGAGVAGFWVDMVQEAQFATKIADTGRFRRSLLAGNPDRMLIGNLGDTDGAFVDFDPAHPVDYRTREYISVPAAGQFSTFAANLDNVAAHATNTDWYATSTQGAGSALRFAPAQMLQATVLNAGSNQYGGGVAWAAGPYAGQASTSLWEDGVYTGLVGLNTLIAPIRESLHNVLPSVSYPTPNTVTVGTLSTPGFVATRSADNENTYIHVLNAPTSGKSITLPAPADGITFTSGTNLRTGRPVALQPNSDGGYTVTLAAADTWDALDTVIVLQRRYVLSEMRFVPAGQFTNSNGGATFSGAAFSGRWAAWDQTWTADSQIEANFTVPDDWNTFRLEVLTIPLGGFDPQAHVNFAHAQIVAGSPGDTDDISNDQTWTLSTGFSQLGVLAPFTPITPRRGALHHLRIYRYGNSSAGASHMYVLGIRLRRLT